VYRQLADIIRSRINSGEYPPGRVIRSLTRIQQETGLTVMTIRKSVKFLEDEGLVEIVPGKGTFVAQLNALRHAEG
jgi:DNA-binding GntR family transcriptional regulator